MTTCYDEHVIRFKALAHPVRLQILDMLRWGEVCVCHMETAIGKRQAYISQQLMSLRDAGLVEARKDGLQVYYRLTDDTVYRILETTLGPRQGSSLPVIKHCPCPHCESFVSTVDILEKQTHHP